MATRRTQVTNRNSEIRIPRFDAYERVMHWMAALSFFYATLTGLALWSPKLYWMATMMGGGYHIRGSHPWMLAWPRWALTPPPGMPMLPMSNWTMAAA